MADLTVTITGKDGVSQVFRAVGDSATKAGDAVERAGKDGAQGLKQIETQAKTTESSMSRVKDTAVAVGAALGVLGTAAAALGKNSRDAELQVDAINRAYTDQADIILDLTERVQDYSRFSNDSAREAALTFQTLTQNYAIELEQLDQLMIRSADVAQLRGRSLEDVSQMLQNAIRGEAEYAEAIGVTLNDTFLAMEYASRGLGNWNTLTDEAARAQFRFQVLMEQTAYASGAAGDAAESAGGQFRQFLNTVDDGAEALGGMLGPIGEVAAELMPIAIVAPVAGAGLGKVSTALAGTAIAARATSLAMSPLTGGLVAVGALLAAGYVAWNVYSDALNSTATAYDNLAESQQQYRLSGQDEIADNFALAETTIRDFEQTLRDLSGQYTTSSGFINMILPTDDAWNAAVDSMNAALNDARIDQEAYLLWVTQQIAMATAIVSDPALFAANPNIITETIRRINEVDLTRFRVETEEAAAAVEQLTVAMTVLDGAASLIGAGFADATGNADRFGAAVALAAIAAADVATESAQGIVAFNDAQQEWLGNGDNILAFWLNYQNALRAAWDVERARQAEMDKPAPTALAPTDSVSVTEAAFESTVRWAVAMGDVSAVLDGVLRTYQQIDDLGQRSESAGSIAEALVGTPGEWAVVDDLLESGRIGLEQYNATVASGYRIQESAARQQMLLNEIRADQLPLLEQTTVAYEQNLARLAAMEPAEQRRALMLQDSAVQTKIASDYALAYSAAIGEIPEEVASSVIIESAEADAGLRDLYLNMGLIEEVWVNGEKQLRVNFPDAESVTDSINTLTDALVMLTDLLDDNVINGSVQIETEQAQSAVDQVIQDIQQYDGTEGNGTLTATDDASPTIQTVQVQADAWDDTQSEADLTANNSQALAATSTAQNAVNDFDATTATATLTANDMASGVIQGALNLLNSLDGRTATATTNIVTRYSTYGAPPPRGQSGDSAFAHGGIAGYAMGGDVVPIWAGEAGPEIAHFAGGGSAWLPREGMYTVPVGTFIEPANSARSQANPGLQGGEMPITVNLTVHGSVISENDLKSSLVTAVTSAVQRRNTAIGVTA